MDHEANEFDEENMMQEMPIWFQTHNILVQNEINSRKVSKKLIKLYQ